MAKIIFFDVDGTLHGFGEKSVRPSVYGAIERARAQGVKCFVATGRHPLEIEEEGLLDGLEFDGYIYLNGSYCVDGNGRVLHERTIDPSQLELLLELRRSEDFAIQVLEADRMYIDRCTPTVERMQKRVNTRVPPLAPDITPALEHKVYQLIIFGKQDVLDRVSSRLPLCSVTRWFEDAEAQDLIPLGGDKCDGIRRVLEYYGVDPAEAAAVGDGTNDVEMLRMLGMGVAMGNGCQAARDAAKLVAPDISCDGLAWAVDRILES